MGRLVASGEGPGDDSFRDVDAWLASVAGSTVGAARSVSTAATRVLEQPEVEAAVRSGVLSHVQAELIATAASADGAAAGRLVEVAQVSGVKGLRTEVRAGDRGGVVAGAGAGDCRARVRAADAAPHEPGRRLGRDHDDRPPGPDRGGDGRARALRAGDLRGQPTCRARRACRRGRVRRDRRGHGRSASPVRRRSVARGRWRRCTSTCRRARSTRVHAPGEVCEIEGVGPIPVGTAYRLASDAVVKALAGRRHRRHARGAPGSIGPRDVADGGGDAATGCA